MRSTSDGKSTSPVSALLLVALLAANAPLPAYAQEAHDFKVAALDPASAIQDFATQSGVQILATVSAVQDKHLNAVNGRHSTDEGLKQLLAGTGLMHEYVGDRAVALVSESERDPQTSDQRVEEVQKPRGFWDRFRLAQATDGSSSSVSGSDDPSASTARIEEVVVTAQKREENLQDVPVPVSAINASALANQAEFRLQDYASQIPGFNITQGSQSSYQILSIRGITDGAFTNPTVGVLVDDVPYGASTALGGGQVVPDIDPGDLARVEVLRGPQGTLYGASSMGGLLKFVTNDPSTAGFTGSVSGGVNSVKNGDDLGYTARGSVNVPLSDAVAMRASAFTHRDAGYIDNPVRGIDGVNEQQVHGGRLAALWQASDVTSLKFSALFQDTKGDGAPYVEVLPGLQGLQQDDLPGTGAYDRKAQVYSATLNTTVGGVDVTAVSGYNINQFLGTFDYTNAVGALATSLFQTPGSSVSGDNRTKKFTQELRLSGSLSERVEWLFGGYYTDERSDYVQTIDVIAPDGSEVHADALFLSFPTKLKEYAAFGDLTYHFTDRFDIQLGGRESWIKQSVEQLEDGVYAPIFTGQPAPVVFPQIKADSTAFTYLVTPRFKITDSMMLYARLASGYRVGGPNLSPGGATPAQYDPDETKNYEIGLKADLLDRRVLIDASLYYIQWQDIQLQAINPQTRLSYSFNGSEAKSQGLELSVETRPVTGLNIAAWVVFSDAELTENLPPGSVAAVSGDRLPYSSRFSGNLSIQQDFPLSAGLSGFVGGSVSYVGGRKGVFVGGAHASDNREIYPSYAKTNLRAGLKFGTWRANAFITNAFDERGIVQGGRGFFNPSAYTYIQPRTVGFSLDKTF